MSIQRLESEAVRVCEQLMLPRDPDLCHLQANLLDHWVKRRRAVGYESELDDAEVIALAFTLREACYGATNTVHSLAATRSA